METGHIQKDELVRAEIISAGQRLFQKYGLDKTTMEDIAREAGKGKSTLYYYFKSKEDIFYAVAHKEQLEAQNAVLAEVEKVKTPSEKLRAFFLNSYMKMQEKFQLYSIIISENTKFIELTRRLQRDMNMADMNLMRQIFLAGIRSGEFKAIKEKDCDAIALLGITMLRGLSANIILAGELPPEELRLDIAIDCFIRGIK